MKLLDELSVFPDTSLANQIYFQSRSIIRGRISVELPGLFSIYLFERKYSMFFKNYFIEVLFNDMNKIRINVEDKNSVPGIIKRSSTIERYSVREPDLIKKILDLNTWLIIFLSHDDFKIDYLCYERK